MIDFSKVRKGAKVRLNDGRLVVVSGMYLSATGLALMVKSDTNQTVTQNVGADEVKELVEA